MTALERWSAHQVSELLAGRPDVVAAIGGAVSCERVEQVRDGLIATGQPNAGGVIRLVHYRTCQRDGTHDWSLPAWVQAQTDPVDGAKALVDAWDDSVIDAIAEAWLSPGSLLETALRGLGRSEVATRLAASRRAADERCWADLGDGELVISAIDDDTEEAR
jgi:hypothetical protein